ncbi:hypothetical protein BZG36_05390, partial [Bifiguratus adelaidae]
MEEDHDEWFSEVHFSRFGTGRSNIYSLSRFESEIGAGVPCSDEFPSAIRSGAYEGELTDERQGTRQHVVIASSGELAALVSARGYWNQLLIPFIPTKTEDMISTHVYSHHGALHVVVASHASEQGRDEGFSLRVCTCYPKDCLENTLFGINDHIHHLHIPYAPMQIWTSSITRDNIEDVGILVSGRDGRVHLYYLASNGIRELDAGDHFPIFGHLAEHKESVLCIARKQYEGNDLIAIGTNSGNIHLALYREGNELWSEEHKLFSPISSMTFFQTTTRRDAKAPLIAPNLLVTCAVEQAIVFHAVNTNAFSQHLTLPESERHDSVLTAHIMDVDWDGDQEILLGTYGRQVLIYKRASTQQPLYYILWQRSFAYPIYGIISLDLNLDGLDELVVVTMYGIHILQPIKMFFLTVCLTGLQFTWSVEMAYGTPYLLSLGLSKSLMSLVWIAGPLSGLVMQPVVGALSDKCHSPLGRRKPFIITGTCIVVVVLLAIGWTREIADLFTGGRADKTITYQRAAIAIAVLSIYLLDFAINTVQASIRALIVDSLPPSQQESGNAWAGRLVGFGSVLGYLMGYIDLVSAFAFIGDTQLKVLVVLASLVFIITVAITCTTVTERILIKDVSAKKTKTNPFNAIKEILRHIRHLPGPIRRLCLVQFFAWMGWFPFMFYSTTWIAEIYTENNLSDSPDLVGQATRAGSYAFLVNSLVSLSASVLLPILVTPSSNDAPGHFRDDKPTFVIRGQEIHLEKILRIPGLTLPRAWTASHFLFFAIMLCTWLASSVETASFLVSVIGVSWAVTMWAPFSLIGEHISSSGENAESGRIGMNLNATMSRLNVVPGAMNIEGGGIYQLVETQEEEGRRGIELNDGYNVDEQDLEDGKGNGAHGHGDKSPTADLSDEGEEDDETLGMQTSSKSTQEPYEAASAG